MKKFLAIIAFFFLPFCVNAQTFDGHCENFSGGAVANISCTLTTTGVPDVIVVYGRSSGGGAAAISDTAALTWHQRAHSTGGGAGATEWYAVANKPLVNDVITVTIGGQTNGGVFAAAFTGNDAATVFPYDTNGSLPSIAATGDPVFSTSNAHDCATAYYISTFPSQANPVAAAGWTTLYGANFTLFAYRCFTTTQSGATVGFNGTNTLAPAFVDAWIDQFKTPTAWAKGNIPTGPIFGLNIAAGNGATYSPNRLLIDVMKFADGDWFTISWPTSTVFQQAQCLLRDANGYPTSLTTGNSNPGCSPINYNAVSNCIFCAGDGTYPSGQYDVFFDGTGTIVFTKDASATCNGTGLGNTCNFTATPSSNGIGLNITSSNPADHIRNIHIVLHTNVAAWQAGEVLDPTYKSLFSWACQLRFMDWSGVNGNIDQRLWQDIPPHDYFTWLGATNNSASYQGPTSASSGIGTKVLTFAPVPSYVKPGWFASDSTNPAAIGGSATAGRIDAVTATTVTIAGAIQSPGVGNGDTIVFSPQNPPSPVGAFVDIANSLNSDIWLTMPAVSTINSSDGSGCTDSTCLIHNMAAYVKANLKTGLRVIVENSNEVWNAPSGQVIALYQDLAQALWGSADYNSYFGYQTVRECQEWKTVFGAQASRIICVMGTQIGNSSITTTRINCAAYPLGPCDHNQGIDAITIAPYFGYTVPDAWSVLDGAISLTTNGTTAAGNNVLHFASTAGVTAGMFLVDNTNPNAFQAPARYQYVTNVTGTTITTIDNAIGSGVGNGDSITVATCGSTCLDKIFNEISNGGVVTSIQTGTLTSGSGVITGLTDTGQISSQATVSGSCIPAGTLISSFDSKTQLTVSQNASCNGAVSLTFSGYPTGMIQQTIDQAVGDATNLAIPNNLSTLFYEMGESALVSPGDTTQWNMATIARQFTGATAHGNYSDAYVNYYTRLYAALPPGGNQYNDISASGQFGGWGLAESFSGAATAKKYAGATTAAAGLRPKPIGQPCGGVLNFSGRRGRL